MHDLAVVAVAKDWAMGSAEISSSIAPQRQFTHVCFSCHVGMATIGDNRHSLIVDGGRAHFRAVAPNRP